MNKQTQEALKMAIEALETAFYLAFKEIAGSPSDEVLFEDALIACKEALATNKESSLVQPAQEPVGWMYENHNIKKYQEHRDASLVLQYGYQETPLYTHPHQWQGLTDDEIYKCQHPEYPDTMYFARAIEQALKEKNHG